MPALAHGREKLHSLFQQPLRLVAGGHHLLYRLADVARAEIEAAIKALHRTVDLIVAQARILDGALLVTRLVEQRIDRQVTVPGYVFEQLGAGIRRSQRDLDRFTVHLARKPHRFLDGVLALARQAEDKGAVHEDAYFMAIAGEAARALKPDAFLDILQDLRVTRFVADYEQTQPAVFKNFQGFVIDIRAGVGRPGYSQRLQ